MLELFNNEHYSRGIQLYDHGLYSEAIVEFECVVDEVREGKSPERKLAAFYMGEAYANLGRDHLAKRLFDQAEEELKLALALYPDYADLHLFLGIAFYKQHNYDDAAKQIHSALQLNPKYAKAMIYLGLTLLRKGSESGLADIASAVAVEPAYDDDRYEKALSFYRDGHIDCALALFEEMAENDVDQAAYLLDKGLRLLEKGDYANAVDVLVEAVSAYPEYPDIKHYLGLCYAHQDKMDKAIKLFKEALEINPAFVAAHINIAQAYKETGEVYLAVQHLKTALSLDPTNSDIVKRLADLDNSSA